MQHNNDPPKTPFCTSGVRCIVIKSTGSCTVVCPLLTCPVNGCGAIYDKVTSFCSHMYRSHRSLSTITDVPTRCTQTQPVQAATAHPKQIETSLMISR